jgi:hypothetical protein
MASYLIEEIIKVTKDPKSRAFWEKAVRVLGEGPAAEELGELKYQMNTREVREPAKYLTALFKSQMDKRGAVGGQEQRRKEPEKLKTHFEETQVALFSNLQPLEPSGETEQKAMGLPYGKDTIPWATFVNSCFFTLSTNKAKSDVVQAKFRTMDGEVSVVPMIRGRMKPGGSERGIPTAEHGRVLAAIKNIWAQQGCQYDLDRNGAAVCFCRVSIRELSQLLGRNNFGGRDLTQIADKVGDLKSMWYYLDLSGLGMEGTKGYGFTLLSKVDLIEGSRHGQPETVLRVDFSTPLSTQLINRHAVTRPMELAQIQSELGFLLRLYLEPILLGMKSPVFSKQLKDLIVGLALPSAKWHGLKTERHRQFKKAIHSMKSQRTADGREIVLSVEKGLSDWMLMARLRPAATVDASGARGTLSQENPKQIPKNTE